MFAPSTLSTDVGGRDWFAQPHGVSRGFHLAETGANAHRLIPEAKLDKGLVTSFLCSQAGCLGYGPEAKLDEGLVSSQAASHTGLLRCSRFV